MVLSDGVGDRLKQHRLTGAWRRDDQAALPLAQRCYQIDDTRGEILRKGFHLQLLFRIERREIVEKDFLSRLIRRFEVDRFNFDQCEIAFAFLRRTNLAADGVAGAKVKLPNLRWRDVNVVRPWQIVVLRRAEKAESIR